MRKPFIVCVQDTLVQVREYVTMAHDAQHARANIDSGVFVTESAPETVDTLDTQVVSIDELEHTMENKNES